MQERNQAKISFLVMALRAANKVAMHGGRSMKVADPSKTHLSVCELDASMFHEKVRCWLSSIEAEHYNL